MYKFGGNRPLAVYRQSATDPSHINESDSDYIRGLFEDGVLKVVGNEMTILQATINRRIIPTETNIPLTNECGVGINVDMDRSGYVKVTRLLRHPVPRDFTAAAYLRTQRDARTMALA